MNKLKKILGNKKNQIIIATVLILSLLIGVFSYAYVGPIIQDLQKTQISVDSATWDEIYFTEGESLSISPGTSNLSSSSDNLSDSTTVSATLTANNTSNQAKYTYNLYLDISKNEYVYTTTSNTPELLLTVIDPYGVEVTEIDGLTYYEDVNGASGFDITTSSDLITIQSDYAIRTTSTNTQNWEITITMINLTTDQSQNAEKTFSGSIIIGEGALVDSYLNDAILEDNGGIATIEAKADPDYSTTSGNGVYATEDEYGTSYYFRGVVDNNWVVFGDENGYPIYWRIVRIDGEGNIKLIYSGINAPTSSTSSVMTGTGTQIMNSSNSTTTAFNSTTNAPYYVGYVYTASEMHGTGTDSTAKIQVDYWYTNVLEDDYDDYIATTMYCIDRVSYTYSSSVYTVVSAYTTGTQYYNAYLRLVAAKTPSLSCVTAADELNLKVGLISADEMSLAGWVSSSSVKTTTNYLYTGQGFWTLSPYYMYSTSSACMFYAHSSGYLYYYTSSSTLALRPTISLDSSVLFQAGDGTYESPYEIVVS